MPIGEETGGGVQIPIEWMGAEQFGVDAQTIRQALGGMFPGDELGRSFAQFQTGLALTKSQMTEFAKTGKSSFALLETGFRNLAYLSGHGMALSRGLNIAKVAIQGVGLELTAATVAGGLFAAGVVATGIVLTKWGIEYDRYVMQIDKIDEASKASSDQTQRLAQVYQLHGKSVADLGKIMAELESKGLDPISEGFDKLAKGAGLTTTELSTALGNLKGFVAYSPETVAQLKAQEEATNRLGVAWLNYKNNVSIATSGIRTAIADIIAANLEYMSTAPVQFGTKGRFTGAGVPQTNKPNLGTGWSQDIRRQKQAFLGMEYPGADTAKWWEEQNKQMGTRLDMTKQMTESTEDYAKSLEDLNKQLQEAYVKGDQEAITKTGEQIKQVTEARGDQQKEWVLAMLKGTEDVSQNVIKQYMLGVGLITQEGLAYEAKLMALIQGAIGGDIQSLVNFVQQVPTIAGGGAAGAKAKFWRPQDFPDVSGYKQKIRAAQMANQFGYGEEPTPTVVIPYAGRGPFEDAGPPTMGQKRGAQAPGIGIGDYNEGLRGAKILQSELGNQAITDGQNIALGLQPAKSVVDDIKQTYLDFINAPAQKTVTVTYITRYVTETAINEP